MSILNLVEPSVPTVPMAYGAGAGGYGMGGGFGSGLVTGLIASVLFNRNGLYGGDGVAAGAAVASRGVSPEFAYSLGGDIKSNASTTDLLQTEASITTALNAQTQFLASQAATNNSQLSNYLDNNFDQTNAIMRNVGDVLFAQNAGIKDAVITNGFAGQLLVKDTQNLIQREACEIKQAIAADGAATRALMTENTIQDLRDRLEDEKTVNNFNSRGLFPATGPLVSVVAQDPCSSKHSQEQINIVNNNVNAIGSTVTQLAAAVNALQTKMLSA